MHSDFRGEIIFETDVHFLHLTVGDTLRVACSGPLITVFYPSPD